MKSAFYSIPILFVAFLITGCGWGRTPSRERFEARCGIEIPQEAKVIKDKYHFAGPDYFIEYDLKLTAESMTTLTKSIRKSAYYEPDIKLPRYTLPSVYIDYGKGPALWFPVEKGYNFDTESREHIFKVLVDTINNTASFEEWLL